uniref:Ig-like domain-containing protein n=1 Tax=Syphacia muris TaxID=451379 RepID=A0A0N5AYI3_9BILA
MQEIVLLLLLFQLSDAFFINSVALKNAKRETACNDKPFSMKCNLQCASNSVGVSWTKLPDICIQSNESSIFHDLNISDKLWFEVDNVEGKVDIMQVTEMDSGYYECVAGNKQAYFYLETKECYDIPETGISIFEDARCIICPTQTPSVIEFTEKPKGQSVCMGSIVPLYCGFNKSFHTHITIFLLQIVAFYNPYFYVFAFFRVSRWDTVEIYWYKDDRLLNERPIRSARTGLIIYDFGPEHCACYKCVVKFPGGSIEATAQLSAQ